MKSYTGFEWLLIDVATNFGKDKLTFEERIQWARENLPVLEALVNDADNKPLYQKAVMAVRKAQQGIPTGHLVGVDATCSGIQIMSVLTGCVAGATATGLVNPDVRADAYSACTEAMNEVLGGSLNVSRADAKQALMCAFYGSKRVPKDLFGENTPELEAFYQAANIIAPGPWDLLQTLLASWRPFALMHSWQLPDGFDARIKVMSKVTSRIEVDELSHSTFTYEYYENEGTKKGKANAANVVHSVDAYVLRCMHRRCNYDKDVVTKVAQLIELELLERLLNPNRVVSNPKGKVAIYVQNYVRSSLIDIVILPFLQKDNINTISTEHLEGLAIIIHKMLQYEPFELVTIHDDFKAHPNNVNWVRYHYKEILSEIAESRLLDDLLGQIFGQPGTFPKLSNNLGSLIKNSNYALC